MCQKCRERREDQARKEKLRTRRNNAKLSSHNFLVVDKLTGSEWYRLNQMIDSSEEDLLLAEGILDSIKQSKLNGVAV